MTAKILQKSANAETGDVLTTFLLEDYPKCLLAEINTHRAASRNSSSSRAIPSRLIRKQSMENPYIPPWTKNQRGMVGEKLQSELAARVATFAWLAGRQGALGVSWALEELGIHKQDANRVLEPWLQLPLIFSATELDNFFELRTDAAAQPTLRRFALDMKDCFRSTPANPLAIGEWHKPYPHLDLRENVARVASVSYAKHDADRSTEDRHRVFDGMLSAEPFHASPFEHIAMAVRPGMMLPTEGGGKVMVFDTQELLASSIALVRNLDAPVQIVTTANYGGFLQGREFASLNKGVFYGN